MEKFLIIRWFLGLCFLTLEKAIHFEIPQKWHFHGSSKTSQWKRNTNTKRNMEVWENVE